MVSVINLIMVSVYMFTLYYSIFWLLALLEVKDYPKKRIKLCSSISVVIPAYNEEEVILKSAKSILDMDYPKDKIQLILVNDGSSDSTMEKMQIIKDKHKDFQITIIDKPNGGKWTALNAGLAVASGEFFACLDADSASRKDAFKKIIPYFKDADVAVVLPLLKVKNPRTFLQRVQWYEYIINMFYKMIIGYLDCIHVAPGPLSVYKTSVLRRVGGFKQGHFTEDLEIVLRLQERHYKIIQITDTEVYTMAPKRIKELYRQRYRWFRGSIMNAWDYKHMMFKKTYGDFGMFQLPVVLVAGFLTVVIVSLLIYSSLIEPVIHGAYNFSLIGFDIIPYIISPAFNFQILDINFFRLAIMASVMTVSLIVVFLAHRYTKENLLKYGVISILAFALFFYLTLGAVWIGVLRDVLLRRKQKW